MSSFEASFSRPRFSVATDIVANVCVWHMPYTPDLTKTDISVDILGLVTHERPISLDDLSFFGR